MKSLPNEYPVICLSHLKWEQTLFQRPQQIMKRLARKRRVLYVSFMPTRDALKSLLRARFKDFIGRQSPNLMHLTLPYFPLSRAIPALKPLTFYFAALAARLWARRQGFEKSILWIYFPAFFAHRGMFNHRLLVYDCMDMFSAFRAEDPSIEHLEKDLIEQADVVFTGGRSLQKAKQGINTRTWCFPSGIDYEHFNKAASEATDIPEDIRDIPRPILGYFGAIDERIDFELLDRLCRTKPEWSVLMIGPFVGLQEPPFSHPNLHFIGAKEYADLPNYLKAFDVCLMPFVNSELTRHISPTKTPEYLAGGKPVVSTPVPDVVSDYSKWVYIAEDSGTFIECVERALNAPSSRDRERFAEKAKEMSWDSIVRQMEDRIAEISND